MTASIAFANPGVQTPVLTSVTPTGGAAGAQSYKLVGIAADGSTTAPSAEVGTVVGPATLDGTHFNTLLWTDPTNVAFVDVYRTVGGLTQGKISRVAAGVGTLVDNGLVGNGATPPSTNTTGVARGGEDAVVGQSFSPGRTVAFYVDGQYAGVKATGPFGVVPYGDLAGAVDIPDASKIPNPGVAPVLAKDNTDATSATATLVLT